MPSYCSLGVVKATTTYKRKHLIGGLLTVPESDSRNIMVGRRGGGRKGRRGGEVAFKEHTL